MTNMDYGATNKSLTSAPSVIHDELGLGIPSWEAMSISQVLLPVLCALFIAGVIVVIACCLIQKKAKSPGVVRQKSSHTIETLHEASDHDIYDVIEEIRAKSLSSDKFQRRQDKMDTNNLIRSHNLPRSDLTNLFANKSSAISLHCASKFDILTSKMSVRTSREGMLGDRRSAANDCRLSTDTDGRVSCVSNGDEGIYETLDRHWTFKNEQLENVSLQTAAKKLVVLHQTGCCHDNVPDICHTNSSAPEASKLRNDGYNCSDSNNGSLVLDMSSSQTQESRTLLCQINMFEISKGAENPTLIETSYYQVNPHISPIHENQIANVSGVFQSSSLRIVPDSTQETKPSPDLVLQALKEEEILQHSLPGSPICNNSRLNKQEKPTKTYEKLHRSNSKRFPLLAVKKSESFRTASSELHTAKEQRRIHRRKSDSSDIDSPLACARTPTRHPNISAGPEATRILTKLGPLPPVPGLSHISQQNAQPKSTKDKLSLNTGNKEISSCEKCDHSVTSSFTSVGSMSDTQKLSSTSGSNEDLQNFCQETTDILSSHPSTNELMFDSYPRDLSIAEDVSSHSRTVDDELQAQSGLDRRGHLENINSSSENETTSIDSDTTSTGSACVVSMDSLCDNVVALEREDDGSNYYFVLESRDGTSCSSSRNSAINGTSNCEGREPTDNMDTHSSSPPVESFNNDDHLSQHSSVNNLSQHSCV